MSRQEPTPGTQAYYDQYHGLPPDHPEYRNTTIRNAVIGVLAVGAAVWLAIGAATAEPSPRPADRPGYEMPAGNIIEPAPGVMEPVNPYGGRTPGPEDVLPLREVPPTPYSN